MEKKKFTVAILGCGERGANTYAAIMARDMANCFTLAALCDRNEEKLRLCAVHYRMAEDAVFTDEDVFFAEKRADLLVIATQDADHARQGLRALTLGYDILLEKPLATTLADCERLLEAQERSGRRVMVCHVLRYAPAYLKVAELLRGGAIGRLVEINALEQVLYWHQAHCYVRGNWRRSEDTSPMILAKCCHDLDYLQFFAGAPCESISSVGDLTFFKAENAPAGAAERCVDCRYIDSCPYSAKAVYIDRSERMGQYGWPASGLTLTRPLTREAVWEAMKTSPYGRCVFHCDNDVVDHELTMMTFANGVKATLTMTGFTSHGGRKIDFRGTYGELSLDEENGFVSLKPFGKNEQRWEINALSPANAGHGGGDAAMLRDLYAQLCGEKEASTSLAGAIESHRMGFCAEESRLAGGALRLVHPHA